jgi:dTDP-4-dehydrorhamnose 3,5-epimerase-like enzyme
MDIIAPEGLPAVRIILPYRHQDARGYFSEIWREDAMRQARIDVRFVQEKSFPITY